MRNTTKWIIAVLLFLSAAIIVSSAAVLSINTPSYGTKGETLTVTVLWDVAPAPGADVYFVLDGGTSSHGQTDASGQVRYKPLLTGNLNITAIYEGITTGKEISVYEPTPTPTPQPPSGGGGGGGGGGGPSGENYTNIEVKENYDLHIFKDKVTSYRYTNRSNPVMFVNITGNINAGEINAAVEVLRNTSTLIKPLTPAPGIVYKNVNIWVGTTGFAVPKNIKIAAIRFKVLNTWLESNSIAASEIRMVKWDGSKWVTLDTTVKEKDGTNTYFEATTDTFSPFAITGLAHAVVVTETPTKQAETATATAVPGIPGFEATIAILVIALLAASLRNDRKRR
jgi:PGF-pre-PGF domain-containing protein